MKAQRIGQTAEQEIHGLIDQWRQAILDHDDGRVAAFYAPDIRAFDAADTLQLRGRDAYRNAWKVGFDHLQGGQMVFDLEQLEITVGDDVAFSTAVVRCGGVGADGTEQTGWMRYTGCWQRKGGRWLVAHEHFSAPFSMQTMQPLFDLKP